VGGVAFPSINAAAIVSNEPTVDDTVTRDMPHELTHLVFHQLINQGITPPRWLDEGLAVYNQAYHEPEMSYSLKQALAAHRLLSLSEISFTFPPDPNQALLAYAQSWNLVAYMYKTFGLAKMARLAKNLDNSNMNFGQDLVQSLGVSQGQLENSWRLGLNQPALSNADQNTPQPASGTIRVQSPNLSDGSAPFFLFAGVLLVVLPLIGVIALLAYQGRRRRVYVASQAQQIMQTTFPPPGSPSAPAVYRGYPPGYPEVPPPLMPNQEYAGQQPARQAPQE
jgi:hypothetical protein